MAFKHSKLTVILVDDVDLSAFINNSNFKKSSKSEDLTTYGKDAEVYGGGLLSGECGISGVYDDGAAGPRATLMPLIGSNVNVKHRPEGTGAGKPQDSFDALIMDYSETAAVAGYRQWACTIQPSDDIDSTDQS